MLQQQRTRRRKKYFTGGFCDCHSNLIDRLSGLSVTFLSQVKVPAGLPPQRHQLIAITAFMIGLLPCDCACFDGAPRSMRPPRRPENTTARSLYAQQRLQGSLQRLGSLLLAELFHLPMQSLGLFRTKTVYTGRKITLFNLQTVPACVSPLLQSLV